MQPSKPTVVVASSAGVGDGDSVRASSRGWLAASLTLLLPAAAYAQSPAARHAYFTDFVDAKGAVTSWKAMPLR